MMPENSKPGVIGQPTYSFAEGYSPIRTTQSAKFTPTEAVRTNASPAPSWGGLSSTYFNLSKLPGLWIWIFFMMARYDC